MPGSLPIAILAGGLATRLRPVTEKIPKSLVTVAGKPFLTHQLVQLKKQGFDRVVLCVGHLGEMIRDQFGDGAEFDLKVSYSFDGEKLLGTGGALRKALPLLGEKFFVLYGDSYLPINFQEVGAAFETSQQPGLMTVYRNEGKWDSSNVWFENGSIRVYDKKLRKPEMRHIDYGLSVLSREAFAPYANAEPFDLADLFKALVAREKLAGFEVTKRFYEIGSPAGLAELETLFRDSKEFL